MYAHAVVLINCLVIAVDRKKFCKIIFFKNGDGVLIHFSLGMIMLLFLRYYCSMFFLDCKG